MRRALVAVAGVAIAYAMATPAFAVDYRADKCFGTATLAGFVGAGQAAEASVEMNFREAEGVPGGADYKPATGWVSFAGPAPGLTFRIAATDVDVTPEGFAWISGTTAQGERYDVLAVDGGTPGAGVDEVWVVRYAPEGTSVSFWSVTQGNIITQAK